MLWDEALGQIDGGRVLDVATRDGHFLQILKEHLKSYTELVGVDVVPPDDSDNGNMFQNDEAEFLKMDAQNLELADSYFDTVAISMGLHHLPDAEKGLAEMLRVLKPGGYLIVFEQFRDGLTPTQENFRDFHHWIASVDRAIGISHSETFTRQQLVEMVGKLGLKDLKTYEDKDLESDPRSADTLEWAEKRIAGKLEEARNLPGYETFKQTGETLLNRIREMGAHSPTRLLLIGRKA